MNGTGGLTNGSASEINIEGSGSVQATLDVANAAAGFGTAGTETGTVFLENDAAAEFKSGQITTVNGTLQLDGAKSFVADAGKLTSNSALTGLTSVAGNFWLQNGATVCTTGNVSVTGNGTLGLDGNNTDGPGGSSLTIGGNLTNSSTNNNGVSVGNTGIALADTLTVNGTGGLSNTGEINIEGSATVQATLNVANAAAGFGTAGVETGTVFLENDALLEFKSGQISTVNGTLQLDGAKSFVADAGKLTSNSALTGLTSVAGNFWLQNGATVSTTGNVGVTGNGTIGLDGNNTDGPGGSSLTIGGKLTNSSTNNNGVSVGNTGIALADTLTVNGTGGLSNTGEINIEGSATVQATLNVANAAAGFGTAGVETGTVFLENDALLEFKSGQISTVNGTLQLDGAKSFVADAGTLGSNSALTGLTSVAGNFWLQNGATVSTTGNVGVTGNGTLGLDGNNTDGPGGSSLTIGGTLTNTSTNNNGVSVGNTGIALADTLTVNGTGGLSNTGEINIEGSQTVQSTLNVANAAAGFGTAGVETGTVILQNDALLEFKSGQIATVNGELWLDGANSRVADAGTLGSNSALTGLTSVSGNFYLENGATVATTGALSVTGNGTLGLDGNNTDGPGGSSLTIGGKLTNSSTNNNGVSVGNTGISSADTLTVNGAGGLSNGSTSEINIEGSLTVQATLNVADKAAGFGTAGVETGTVFLQNDALLEFKSGQITTVDGTLWLDGANSRVARAAAPATNSALTGLTTVAGDFWLENGAKVSPTGNVTITGNGTIELDGNNIGGGGGSSLTIGGTLTNSSTNTSGVSIGNGGITSADTLTVNGAGGLSNTGEIIIEGSASATASLVVSKTATTSGTIVIDPFGDLTATTVDVIGGTLEGVGTVTGTLNDTGGTVVGGSLDGNTGTLTESGAYKQSGSGVLQTDIDTGDSQQSSIIAVTGSPGTPGAKGSVNLAGGTLLIDAESSLALNTPYTVMTFGKNDLYGQFAQVETEGSLGSHTGNSNSVNVGGGDTLEVLYNEASGDIQVELVTTPASTTYTWDVGAGTWNASSGGDWNPPDNGTTPSATSNVEIGTGGGGTVTLAQDQTIASLSITNGYTLSGATHSITVTGNVSVVSGAVLSIDDMNVGGAFTDSGSATFAGVLTINSGGSLTLSNGSLSGGINGTGTFESSGSTDTLTNVTIYSGTTYTASNGVTTDITGTLGGKGTLQVNGGDGNNGILQLIGATTLSGGGTVPLTTATGGGNAFIEGNSETLTNASDVIEGTGDIGNGSLAVINGGTIDANSSAGAGALILNGSGGITNADGATGGLLEATSGGTLEIDGITVNNASGAITADGGTVEVINATIEGGTLNTLGGGTMESAGSDATLDGTTHGALTISAGSTYTASNGVTTDILGAITDKGTIQLNGGDGNNGILDLTGAMTLSGGGVVAMTTAAGGGAAFIEGNSETLTNDDVIEGTGTIGNGSLAVTNSGTIDANSSAGALTLDGSGGVTNTGVLEATSSGTLQVNDITVNNAGHNITANDGVVEVINATIQGGTLNTLGGGTMESAGSDATLDGTTHGALTISTGSIYAASNGVTTDILGAITDKGTIQVNGGAGNNGILDLTGATTLSGGGTMLLTTATGGGNAFVEGNGETLTNADVIEGTGEIGNGSLAVINGSTIDADSSTGTATLILNGSGGITNANGATGGLLKATGGGTLEIDGIGVNNAGGAITANGGTVEVINATIQGGTLNTLAGGTMESAGSDATLDGKTQGALTISTGSIYTASNGVTTDILGAITDKGTIQLNGGDGNNGILDLTGATTLSGGGVVTMTTASGGGAAFIEGNSETLTNSDVIEGTGTIGNGSLALTSSGTIDANVSAGTLTLNGSGGDSRTPAYSKRRPAATSTSPARFQERASLKSAPIRRLNWAAPRAKIRPSSAPLPPRFLSTTRRPRPIAASSIRLSKATSSSLGIQTPPPRPRRALMARTRPLPSI